MDDISELNAIVEQAGSMPRDTGPAPKQLRIIRKLVALLEATSGYEGVKVYKGLSVLPAEQAKDAMSVLEAPRPVVGSPAGEFGLVRNEPWTLLVQGWPENDADAPSEPAYWMKAAVEQQLSLIGAEFPDGRVRTDPLYMLGGDIHSLTIGQGVVRPAGEEASSRLAMFYLPLIIGMTTDARDPYA